MVSLSTNCRAIVVPTGLLATLRSPDLYIMDPRDRGTQTCQYIIASGISDWSSTRERRPRWEEEISSEGLKVIIRSKLARHAFHFFRVSLGPHY